LSLARLRRDFTAAALAARGSTATGGSSASVEAARRHNPQQGCFGVDAVPTITQRGLMRLEFVQTHGEFAAAWLGEYYRAPRRGTLRVLGGPALGFFGWRLGTLRPGEWPALVGAVALGLGVYTMLKPLLEVALLVRKRHALGGNRVTIVVDLADDAITVASGPAETKLGWDRISCAGQRSSYLWFEVAGATRAIIPLRAIADREAVVALFRAKGKWARG
jgi:hypothetical protein